MSLLQRLLLAALVFLSHAAWANPAPNATPDLSSRIFRMGSDLVDLSSIDVVGLGPAGTIYVSGPFDSVDGLGRPHGVARLSLDGNLDTAWTPSLPPGTRVHAVLESAAGAVLIRSTGAILLVPSGAASSLEVGSQLGAPVWAFDSDGGFFLAIRRATASLLNPYAPTYVDIKRYRADGSLDPGFGTFTLGGEIVPCFFLPSAADVRSLRVIDGLLYVGGDFTTPGFAALRLSATSGSLDTTWKPISPGTAAGHDVTGPKATCASWLAGVTEMLPAGPDGVYIAGYFHSQGRKHLARFSRGGTGLVDPAWAPTPTTEGVVGIELDPSGQFIYVRGGNLTIGGARRSGLAAYSTGPGAALSPWDPGISFVARMVATADRLLVAGPFSTVGNTPRTKLASLPLAGTMTGPFIAFDRLSLDFGPVLAGSSATRDLVVSNVGDAPLVVSGIELGWPGATPVPVPASFTHDCAVLAPAATCTIRVTLQLSTAWPLQLARLTITSNGSGTPQAVDLVWSWRVPRARLESLQGSAPTLASTPPGYTRRASLRLSNSGNAPLQVTAIAVSSLTRLGEYAFAGTDCPVQVPAFNACLIHIAFSPTGLGPSRAEILLSLGAPAVAFSAGQGEVLMHSVAFPVSGHGAGPQEDSDGDGLSNSLEASLGLNPLVKDNAIFASSRLFAMQQYRDFLAREGEDAGIAFWTAALDGGSWSRPDVVQSFITSPEFQGFIAPVARLYFAYFLRVPDYAGLTHWIAQNRAGTSLDSISNTFASSAEFGLRYGALGNAEFVELVYRNVLGRASDAAGFAHWKAHLDSGAMTRGQVMLAFSESPEYRSLSAAEVLVTMAYVGMLRRTPEPAGFAFWVNYLDAGNSVRALLEGFLAGAEYRARFLQ